MLRAPSLATTSTVAPLVVGTWTATDDTHIVMNGTGAPTEGSCTSSQLTLGSFIDARVEASLAASLTSNLETLGLSWSAARVGK